MPGSQGAKILQRRGLKPETIEEWKIGFIPEQWDPAFAILIKKAKRRWSAGFWVGDKKMGPTPAKGFDGQSLWSFPTHMFPLGRAWQYVSFTVVLVETEKSAVNI